MCAVVFMHAESDWLVVQHKPGSTEISTEYICSELSSKDSNVVGDVLVPTTES